MKRSECTFIGRILKPHGIKGELGVKFIPEWLNSKKFRKQKFVFAEVYPGDELVPFFIESGEADDSGQGRIKFEDFNTIESVSLLVNKDLFIPAEVFQSDSADLFGPTQLKGFLVKDLKAGDIGIVEDVLQNQKQEMLLIRSSDREILIPWVKEFLKKVDKKGKVIHMKIPEGLIDLNIP